VNYQIYATHGSVLSGQVTGLSEHLIRTMAIKRW
jgi:hypothetical protein